MKKSKILSNSLMILFLAAMLVLPASAALSGVSPVNSPANGFPLWYQDTNGLALEPCLANATGFADNFCVLPTVAPLEPNFQPPFNVVFPTNFPSETFYWIADSDDVVGGPNGTARIRFRMALEGAFSGGPPLANDQVTFLRINLQRFSPGDLVPNSTYSVTYPFGTFQFTTDAEGGAIGSLGNQAFRTEDPLNPIPGVFTGLLPATTTGIGPFLAQANMPPGGFTNPQNPTAHYIGDGATIGPITPGPNGASLIITGPSIGGPGTDTVTQNLWTVAGRIFTASISGFKINDTNGNGVFNPGEPGIAGWNITLKNATTGAPITSVLTDPTGAYSFPNLNPGLYNVTEETRAGFNPTNATFKVINLVQDMVNQNFTNNVTVANVTANLTTITVAPATAVLTVNQTLVFTATAMDQNGAPMQGINITWTSSNATVGNVTPLNAITNAAGIASTTFTAKANGIAMVNATNATVSGNATVTVSAGASTLTTITVTPLTAALNAGGTQVFTATARDQNNVPMQGISITWTSSNLTVGSVAPLTAITDVNGNALTTFTALGAGTALVNATSLAVKGTATVTVSPKVLAADIVGLGFGAGAGTGTKGGFINVSVNVTNLDTINTTTYVVEVSGVAADGSSLVGTGTVMLAPSQTINNVPIVVTVPTVKPAGSYTLFATIWKLADFPTTPQITRGPITATVV